MGFLSKAIKSIGGAIIAPTKFLLKGIQSAGRAVWRGTKKVMAQKWFKIAMLALSVVTMGMALVGGVVTFVQSAGQGLLSAALKGGGAMLNSLTGGIAGKIGGAVQQALGFGEAAATAGQALSQAGNVATIAQQGAQASNLISASSTAIDAGSSAMSIAGKLKEFVSPLTEAFQGFQKTAMEIVNSPIKSLQKAWEAAKASIGGGTDLASIPGGL